MSSKVLLWTPMSPSLGTEQDAVAVDFVPEGDAGGGAPLCREGKNTEKAFYEELIRAADPGSIPIPGSRRMEQNQWCP